MWSRFLLLSSLIFPIIQAVNGGGHHTNSKVVQVQNYALRKAMDHSLGFVRPIDPVLTGVFPHLKGFSSSPKSLTSRPKVKLTAAKVGSLFHGEHRELLSRLGSYDRNLVFRTHGLDGSERIVFYNSDKSVKHTYKVMQKEDGARVLVPYKLTESKQQSIQNMPEEIPQVVKGLTNDLVSGFEKVSVKNKKISYLNEKGKYEHAYNELKVKADDARFNHEKKWVNVIAQKIFQPFLDQGFQAKIKYGNPAESPLSSLFKNPVVQGEVTKVKFGGGSFKPIDLGSGSPKSLKLELPLKNGEPDFSSIFGGIKVREVKGERILHFGEEKQIASSSKRIWKPNDESLSKAFNSLEKPMGYETLTTVMKRNKLENLGTKWPLVSGILLGALAGTLISLASK